MTLDGPSASHVIDLDQFRRREPPAEPQPDAAPLPMPGSTTLLIAAMRTTAEIRRMVEHPRRVRR